MIPGQSKNVNSDSEMELQGRREAKNGKTDSHLERFYGRSLLVKWTMRHGIKVFKARGCEPQANLIAWEVVGLEPSTPAGHILVWWEKEKKYSVVPTEDVELAEPDNQGTSKPTTTRKAKAYHNTILAPTVDQNEPERRPKRPCLRHGEGAIVGHDAVGRDTSDNQKSWNDQEPLHDQDFGDDQDSSGPTTTEKMPKKPSCTATFETPTDLEDRRRRANHRRLKSRLRLTNRHRLVSRIRIKNATATTMGVRDNDTTEKTTTKNKNKNKKSSIPRRNLTVSKVPWRWVPATNTDMPTILRMVYQKGTKGKLEWQNPEQLMVPPGSELSVIPLPLPLGGDLQFYPKFVSCERLLELKKEMLNMKHYRQYRVQNMAEPRVHVLFHEDASNARYLPQPGYRYHGVTMMAKPLSLVQSIRKLSQEMAEKCNVKGWGIGVDAICYRGHRDSISAHADEDQGETKIVSVTVKSPCERRRVVFQPKKENLKLGSVRYVLFPGEGDVYVMDGEMQKHYTHAVPKHGQNGTESAKDGEQDRLDHRLSLIFRDGAKCLYERDSGQPIDDLNPRKILKPKFGEECFPKLRVGQWFTRAELYDRSYHHMAQRGVSGNMIDGADAIIDSGLSNAGRRAATGDTFEYYAKPSQGSKALLYSFQNRKLIRVFRGETIRRTRLYRYEGLYELVSERDEDTQEQSKVFCLQKVLKTDNLRNRT